ncbi:MAG TPA: 50S ribosomal protein L25 [Patescibacteria group bacterium]|jgi:large subunit ribosomal protein L25|nr:50S ribosomal protein L25 [Patescibacteria group bacterium]
MDVLALDAVKRVATGKQVKKLRTEGKLPAVLYGHDLETEQVEINEKDFLKLFKKAGENTLVSLVIDGKTRPVLIHDVQNHYLTGHPSHVDFYAVNMTEKLRARIPVHFVGESPAVKALGGILVKNTSEVEVECLPGDLPQNFEVDISRLNTFEDAIRISDLSVSDKVKILAHPDELVINAVPPRSEAELEELKEKPVVEDVTKVEGVAQPEPAATTEGEPETKDKDKEKQK